MKKYMFHAWLVALALLCGALAACSESKDNGDDGGLEGGDKLPKELKDVIGRWRCITERHQSQYGEYLIIDSDGTGAYFDDGEKEAFRWSYEKSSGLFKVDFSDRGALETEFLAIEPQSKDRILASWNGDEYDWRELACEMVRMTDDESVVEKGSLDMKKIFGHWQCSIPSHSESGEEGIIIRSDGTGTEIYDGEPEDFHWKYSGYGAVILIDYDDRGQGETESLTVRYIDSDHIEIAWTDYYHPMHRVA